jgi:hypothetical protein
MKTLALALLTAASFGAATFTTLAQTATESAESPKAESPKSSETPRVVIAQTNTLTATVEDIDYDKREITLKGPEGKTAKFVVSKDVKNFAQMKKGDEVRIGYYESIGLAIRKPGEALSPTSRTHALITREPGQKPGAAEVAVSEITATVEDIDRDKREVTLKGPEGNMVTVEVDPSVGDLSRINKGDQITATRTEALAVTVEKP